MERGLSRVVVAALAAILPYTPAPGASAQVGAGSRFQTDTTFTVPMPGHRFFSGDGAVLFITAIGPVADTRLVQATFNINYNSDGTTPARDIRIIAELPMDGQWRDVVVTGADLGFGDGAGMHRGTFVVHDLDGTVDNTGGLPHSLIDLSIDTVDNEPIEGRGFFVNSSITFATIPADAVATIETFEDGVNEAGWSFGTGNEFIADAGGNPGRYLHEPFVVSFGPGAITGLDIESEFTGNFAARNVIGLGIDLKTFSVAGGRVERNLSLILYNDNSTPHDFQDDWGAYVLGTKQVPPVIAGPNAAGWINYDFIVDSRSSRAPEGWVFFGDLQRRGWSDLMADVTCVEFFYGHPGQFQIVMEWSVGLDNPRIHTRPGK